MFKRLGPIEFARCLAFGGSGRKNRAHTLDAVCNRELLGPSGLEALRMAACPRGRAAAWACVEGNRRVALAAAARRYGPQSWQISHLLVEDDGATSLPTLLEHVAGCAADAGAERVFLRLRAGDPLADQCRKAGFFPSTRESLYRGVPLKGGEYASPYLRERRPSDDHALHRLYSVATPAEVRAACGMTLEQWSSARERYLGRAQEFVYEKDGAVRAWVQTTRRLRSGHLAIDVHPDETPSVPFLVRFALSRLVGAASVICLPTERQTSVQRALRDQGFEAIGEYVLLVRSTVATVAAQEARAPATIASVWPLSHAPMADDIDGAKKKRG